MMYQVIDGQKLWSAGAMWFKVPNSSERLERIIQLRKQQIVYYSGGDPATLEALTTLANEGIFKSYNETFTRHIETIVDRMKVDGVHKIK